MGDEAQDGELHKEEARHMVVDLAELTVEWAKENEQKILGDAHVGEESDTEELLRKNRETIDAAYKLIKDDKVITDILHDFDTDGDGKISREEFVAKACEGYNILERPAKRVKTSHGPDIEPLLKRIRPSIDVFGTEMSVQTQT